MAEVDVSSIIGYSKARIQGSKENLAVCPSYPFNDAKNRHGFEHICHHHPNSLLINWLIIALTLTLERLYRCRYLHHGTHGILQAIRLLRLFWISLGRKSDTS